ncbi:MAG: tetratricopeptide repeat protein, partial [Phocaeicola sp.]
QLKNYPFFYDMAHWFFQFDTEQIDLTIILGEQQREDNLLKVILDIPAFCNSDKYSFYYTLVGLNDMQRSAITQQFNLQKEQLSEEQNSMLTEVSKREINEADASRQYIHDLYRFFKLWRNRSEEIDIFTNSFHLWECKCLSDTFVDHKALKEIADYFLKNDYPKEAAALYEKLLKICFTEAEYWQKAGYAFQKQKEYKKAIEYYLQADIVKPDSLWVNKNLAQCYRKIGEIDSALTYYKNIATLEPDNLSTTLQIGYCLVELQQYEEALPYFFKVEYYDKNPIKAQRAIGWCYFVLSKYADAINKLKKVTESEKATLQDWLNIGHAYYANKEVQNAIVSYQKAADLSKNRENFISTFLADQPILAHHNFTVEELYLLLDQLS